ncbi:MAG: nuclear transport factor 2 family protein [Bacteroidetes bacterium]|nr:nuclear transport factor 2 family protein [Bacteroidota bacterium]
MKKVLSFPAIILVVAMAIISCNSCTNKQQQTADNADSKTNKMKIEEIIEANNELYAGLNAMFIGNLEALNALWSHSDSITYMGPFGGCLKGWNEVDKEFTKVAAMKLGGKITCNDLHVFAGTDLGYTTCVEEGENIGPDGKPVSVSHRATNIFHLENGKWRLIHHHTDISSQLEKVYDKEIDK